MAIDIEKEYNSLAKKYKLPSFTDINDDFEVSDIESSEFILRNVLRKMAEKLEFYTGLISEILQPDASSLSNMHETRFFNDADKTGMYELFKRMMKNYREIISLVLNNDEKEQAMFLSEFYGEWAGMKKQLLSYLDRMKNSWENETTIKEDLGYFG